MRPVPWLDGALRWPGSEPIPTPSACRQQKYVPQSARQYSGSASASTRICSSQRYRQRPHCLTPSTQGAPSLGPAGGLGLLFVATTGRSSRGRRCELRPELRRKCRDWSLSSWRSVAPRPRGCPDHFDVVVLDFCSVSHHRPFPARRRGHDPPPGRMDGRTSGCRRHRGRDAAFRSTGERLVRSCAVADTTDLGDHPTPMS